MPISQVKAGVEYSDILRQTFSKEHNGREFYFR